MWNLHGLPWTQQQMRCWEVYGLSREQQKVTRGKIMAYPETWPVSCSFSFSPNRPLLTSLKQSVLNTPIIKDTLRSLWSIPITAITGTWKVHVWSWTQQSMTCWSAAKTAIADKGCNNHKDSELWHMTDFDLNNLIIGRLKILWYLTCGPPRYQVENCLMKHETWNNTYISLQAAIPQVRKLKHGVCSSTCACVGHNEHGTGF